MFRPFFLVTLLFLISACKEQVPPPPAVTRNLAPDGVFYTMTALRVSSATGPVDIPAATLVVKNGKDSYRTTDGIPLTLAPQEVTNDLQVLKHIQKADQALRAETDRREAERKAAEREAALEAERARMFATPRSATPRPWGTSLDQKSYNERRGVTATPVLRSR